MTDIEIKEISETMKKLSNLMIDLIPKLYNDNPRPKLNPNNAANYFPSNNAFSQVDLKCPHPPRVALQCYCEWCRSH